MRAKHNHPARHRAIAYATALLALCFAGCHPGRIYMEATDVPPSGWHMDSAITFEVEITDTLTRYDMLFFIRHSTDYPFQNIWLFADMTLPNDSVCHYPMEFYLADQRGQWLGNGSGAVREMPAIAFIYQQPFPMKGKYTFSLRQGMREETLKGISNIGIEIRKSKDGKE